MQSLNVLGVSSSMREGSFGTRTLKLVLRHSTEIWDQDSSTRTPKNEDASL